MEELFASAGPFAIVFVGMSGVIGWVLKDRGRLLSELAVRTEQLLDERQKRADAAVEAAKLFSSTTEIVKGALTEHDRKLERLLLVWESSRS